MRGRTVVAVLVPLAGLLAGAGAAVVLDGDGGSSATTGAAGGPSGVVLDAATLDAVAPPAPLPPRADSAIIDLASVVGYPAAAATEVPPGAAVVLQPGQDGTVPVVDPATGDPVEMEPPAPVPPIDPVASPPLVGPATPVATVPGNNAAPAATPSTVPAPAGAFTDPCAPPAEAGPVECSGAPAAVAPPTSGSASTLAPLALSVPFAAAAGMADMCEQIERGAVADPQLAAAARPTVAVLVNQPASLALTGTWADGTAIEKRTMLTLADHDDAWREDAAAGRQGRILACLTFPLDEARSHARGGRADLTAEIIAIGADGQATSAGAVTLEVPLDGDDTPFADSLSVRGLGEQLLADGRRAPALAVHYVLLDEARVPAGAALEAATTVVQHRHAVVENADCSGWAVNRQGQDRTLGGTLRVRQEQRTIAGRQRSVTVVDGVVHVDPNVRSGWEGFLCLELTAEDRTGARAVLALRGAAVRAPRTARYDIAVRADHRLPDGWELEVAWAGADGRVWCGPTVLGSTASPDAATGTPGTGEATGDEATGDEAAAAPVLAAGCTTLARLHPSGVTLALQPRTAAGDGAPWTVHIPVNTAYCNPDDPNGAAADGCSTGWQQTWTLGFGDEAEADITIVVLREAGAGQVLTNPSHAWRIDPTQAFRTS